MKKKRIPVNGPHYIREQQPMLSFFIISCGREWACKIPVRKSQIGERNGEEEEEEEEEEGEEHWPFLLPKIRPLPNKMPERLPLKGLEGLGAVQFFLGLTAAL